MLSGNFDSEVWTAKFALHAFDAGFKVLDCSDKTLHLKDLGGAELDADMTPLAVFLDDLDFWQFFLHLERLLYFRNKRCNFSSHNVAKEGQAPFFCIHKRKLIRL